MSIQSVTRATRKKKPSSPNRSRTYNLLVTSPDALPLSYRSLVGAKANKGVGVRLLFEWRFVHYSTIC